MTWRPSDPDEEPQPVPRPLPLPRRRVFQRIPWTDVGQRIEAGWLFRAPLDHYGALMEAP